MTESNFMEVKGDEFAGYSHAPEDQYSLPSIIHCPNPDCQYGPVQAWMSRTYQRKDGAYWAYLYFRCDECGWEVEGPTEGKFDEIIKRWGF